MNTMLAIILASIVNGALCTYISRRKERNPYAWFLVGFLFGLPGLIVAVLMPRKKPKETFTLHSVNINSKPSAIGPPPPQKYWYYLDPNHEQHGPMSFDALRSEWNEGRLRPSTYVWNEELESWKHLRDLKEFTSFKPAENP